MKYVYILKSVSDKDRRYVGLTSDLRQRFKEHNQGKSVHTARFRPWRLETYVAFSDYKRAQKFEKYLKHGSGWAFAKRRL